MTGLTDISMKKIFISEDSFLLLLKSLTKLCDNLTMCRLLMKDCEVLSENSQECCTNETITGSVKSITIIGGRINVSALRKIATESLKLSDCLLEKCIFDCQTDRTLIQDEDSDTAIFEAEVTTLFSEVDETTEAKATEDNLNERNALQVHMCHASVPGVMEALPLLKPVERSEEAECEMSEINITVSMNNNCKAN